MFSCFIMRKTLCSLVLALSFIGNSYAQDLSKIIPFYEEYTLPEIAEPKIPKIGRLLEKSYNCKELDIMFLFDTTSSMSNQLFNATIEARRIVLGLKNKDANVRFAVAKVEDFPFAPYGESANIPYELVQGFTDNANIILNGIDSLYTIGGRDESEAYAYALRNASNEKGWRGNVRRYIILFADSTNRHKEELEDAIIKNNADIIGVVDNYNYWEGKIRAIKFKPSVSAEVIKYIKETCELFS